MKKEHSDDELLTQKELCDLFKISEKTAESWRFYGRGPGYIKLSKRCIRYRKSDVFEYMTKNTVAPIA